MESGGRRLGESLKLPGTPTFILCCPDKRVFQLGSLEQCVEFLHKGSGA
jgi:hypothetical protein